MDLDLLGESFCSISETFARDSRRRISLDPNDWWQRLSIDQKFGVYQLSKFGFELAFIRNTSSGPLAVLRRSREYATVDQHGEVDLQPQIKIRD